MPDDLCDLCMSSQVNVNRTTYCGKTIGIECGCDDTHADGTCGDPGCETCKRSQKPSEPEKAAQEVLEIKSLRLATIYGDDATSLVSVTHRVVIGDFDGEKLQKGIPHVHLTHDIEQKAGEAYWGEKYNGDEEGFPGWTAVFEYLDAHPSLLEEDPGEDK